MKKLYFSGKYRPHAMALWSFFVFCFLSFSVHAQVIPSTGYTAMQLATKLAGPGVTISSSTLTCPQGASGEFKTIVSNLGIDCGVVLTNGQVVAVPGMHGINITDGGIASSELADNDNMSGGDPDLATLSSNPTNDACVLEFDFIPIGTTISVDYVFGSEEYTSWTCSSFNDVFGFFISGGAYATPTNIALVPGTSIPVAVNSINCGATGGFTLALCTAMGPGSPFCTYFVNNASGTTVMYDGFTTVLAATANVTPCVTHHLKLGVADASDHALDSGVFLKAGSLTSVIPESVSAIGIAPGVPAIARTCVPGKFRFTTTPHCTSTDIVFAISGSAVNGTDYATITNTVTIPASASFADVNINSLPLPPTFPKTVTVTILHPDHCDPSILVPATPPETATLTIYDTFYLKILTPPDTLCKGDNVHILVDPDPVFGPFMSYTWTPTAGLSSSTIIDPVASPVITTTYTIKENLTGLIGCRETDKDIKITVFDKPILTTDSPLVKTCVGTAVPLHVTAWPDTLTYTYTWAPPTDLSNSTIWNPVVDPSVPGNTTYTVTVAIDFLPNCKSTDTVKVHVLPNDFTLNNDTIICIGQFVQGSANGDTEFTWR